jgi:hypothetical protein
MGLESPRIKSGIVETPFYFMRLPLLSLKTMGEFTTHTTTGLDPGSRNLSGFNRVCESCAEFRGKKIH